MRDELPLPPLMVLFWIVGEEERVKMPREKSPVPPSIVLFWIAEKDERSWMA